MKLKKIFSDRIVALDDQASFSQLALDVLVHLQDSSALQSPFCLWLQAEMGSGKTTFVRELLYTLGLNRALPVTSPTYTYCQDYTVQGETYAHLDLYRFGGQAKVSVDDMLPAQKLSGLFVEWPESGGETARELAPTHVLTIETMSPQSRSYSFYKAS